MSDVLQRVRDHRFIPFFCFVILFLIVAGSGAAQNSPNGQIPLAPEDWPDDLMELELGPWDGFWVIRSADFDGQELTTYFCSDLLGGVCLGNEYVRPEEATCSEGDPVCEGEDCSGPCEGSEQVTESKYGHGCTTDANCTPSDSMDACDDAKAKAKDKADATCTAAGGANCVCYAHTKVTAKSGKCKSGLLARYCKYRCTATAKGNCAASW